MIGPSDIQIILGKVRPLSRPHTEAHPQVLIIARDEAGAAKAPGVGTNDRGKLIEQGRAERWEQVIDNATTVIQLLVAEGRLDDLLFEWWSTERRRSQDADTAVVVQQAISRRLQQ